MFCSECGKWETGTGKKFCSDCEARIENKMKVSSEGAKMDFKKLAIFIIALGAVILAVGLVIFISNLDSIPLRGDTFVRIDELMYREYRRGYAIIVMSVGAIVAFIGFAIGSSAKKNKN